MLSIEKKLYAFIDKHLHLIVAMVVAAVVFFLNRQVLHCVRPHEGADMWEASNVYVHSPLYTLLIRILWINLFSGNYDLYHVFFWPFSYCVAFLAATLLHRERKKVCPTHTSVNTTIFFCIALITPLALLYGPVMLHMDGISVSLILLGTFCCNYLPKKVRILPMTMGLTLAVSLQSCYAFFALGLIIYGVFKKKRTCVSIPLISVALSFMLNLLVGTIMGYSATESLHMIFRFFYISQATGAFFSSFLSWLLYMLFWNGYWIGMLSLFAAFLFPKRAPAYALLHIVMFFFSVSIFLNGYV